MGALVGVLVKRDVVVDSPVTNRQDASDRTRGQGAPKQCGHANDEPDEAARVAGHDKTIAVGSRGRIGTGMAPPLK